MISAGMYLSNRYEVIERIGSGGMADVYKAKDDKLGRYVALKVLKNDFAADENFIRKFRAEARSAAVLSNPHIVNIYDVGEDGDVDYIVMELVEGITLKKYINLKGRLNTKEALNIAVQIATGLSAAHNKRIIHRDIKPQNVIISRDGKAKITDFGIAKRVDSATVTASNAGSVHYISPEQARGGFTDARSDIYSLGIAMYEMVTGQVPFTGDTNVAVALAHIHDEITPPKDLVPDLPESFNRVILKCTAKKPDNRYQSAVELIEDLRRVTLIPDGAYVNAAGAESAATVVMTPEEISGLKAAKGGIPDPEGGKVKYNRDEVRSRAKEEYEPEDDGDDDDDGEDESPRRLEKTMLILAIVGSIVLVFVIGFIIINATGMFSSSEDETVEIQSEMEEKVVVPDFSKKTLKEARILAKEKGLELSIEEEKSDDVEEGSVIRQDIKAGEEVEKGSTIKIYICSGANTIEVEDVVNKPLAEAKRILKSAGFEVKVEEEASDKIDEGNVIRTDPKAGSKLTEGEEITVYVSSGKGKIKLPSVEKQSENTAITSLKSAGFEYVSSSSEHSSTVDKGKVISVYINGSAQAAGSEWDEGTKVYLIISSGPEAPEKITVPYNIVGNTPEVASEIINGAGLKCDEKTDCTYTYASGVDESTYTSETVTAVNPSSGTAVDPGTRIKLTVLRS